MPETAQPAPETDEKKSRGLGSYVLWAFVAVMVYVLSSGPAIRIFGVRRYVGVADAILVNRDYPPWMQIYRPLEGAYKKTILHRPLGMYWHLCCPDAYGADGELRRVLLP